MASSTARLKFTPTIDEIRAAGKDVGWEYAAMLGAAVEIAKGNGAPANHFAMEAFLVHVRNLAEFFREGTNDFLSVKGAPPREKDNIYAVDFCDPMKPIGWNAQPFDQKTKLIMAINKTLSHMTYSRDKSSKTHAAFEGSLHTHGTVRLMQQTWAGFVKSLRAEVLPPQCSQDLHFWLAEHTRRWSVPFNAMETDFYTLAKQWSHWKYNQTPDGPV